VSRQLCHCFHSLFNIPRRLIDHRSLLRFDRSACSAALMGNNDRIPAVETLPGS
jgi:hypothetical protein